MRSLVTCSVALAVASLVSVAQAEVKSGPQAGESVGAFTVEKIAGNANDGVADGKKLCYRCKMGNKPVVAVFSRSTDPSVATLMKKLDAVSAKNADKGFVAYVNLLGDNPEALKKDAKSLVEKSGTKHIAVVVPKDHKTGPANHKLSDKADVTVVIYKKGKVAVNHAVAGKLDDARIAQIVKDTGTILQ
ncbi:MAG: hypothetical protein MI757_17215 [Pirellulales bacterium]|nr:hypothetical protein [Pirellulales bacterium]